MTENDVRPEPAGTNIVEIRNLTRCFGKKTALDDVSLTVPAGSVFGLIGENGAGKTTIIKHILGLLRAAQGTVRVFGLDPVADPVGVLSRVGYLSEESEIPQWMRIDELLRYMQAFYAGWDEGYADTLRGQFGLQMSDQIKNLSKGQRARAALLVALAYRPDLLLLDEPSSGLDPIVRRDILGAIVRTIADEGRTVLFSSHLLGEVDRVCDYLAMVKGGRIVLCDTLDRIKELHFRATIQFASNVMEPPVVSGILGWQGSGREWTAVCAGDPERWDLAGVVGGARVVKKEPATLEEIFFARAGAIAAPALEE